jgi:hypothetical protein
MVAKGGQSGQGELQRKIFVLVTSGYLLQYSEHGPSGRLPERVLPVDGQSAVFVSDLIPGQPFVLQVSQAVDEHGLAVNNSGSVFSRMGIQSAAAKRTVSSMWLVLPDAEAMGTWLHAVREQLEVLHTMQARADAAEVRSHSIASDNEAADPEISRRGRDEVISRSNSPLVTRGPSSEQSEPKVPMVEDHRLPPNVDEQPKTSIEEAEDFADRLAMGASYVRPNTARARSPSSAPSMESSIAQSLDQQRLNSLRSSVRTSGMSNATAMTSRTSSMTSETASNKPSLEVTGFRNLSSYNSAGSSKRRSAMPAPSILQAQPEVDAALATKIQSPMLHLTSDDSPTIPHESTPLLSTASVMPDPALQPKESLSAPSDLRSKHDSKFDSAFTNPVYDERPLSIIGDLPSPSTWAKALPAKRNQASPLQERQLHRMSSAPALRNTTALLNPSKRKSSQPFTLPLRINPSVPVHWKSAGTNERSSPARESEGEDDGQSRPTG